jgi:hypothetical protein
MTFSPGAGDAVTLMEINGCAFVAPLSISYSTSFHKICSKLPSAISALGIFAGMIKNVSIQER